MPNNSRGGGSNLPDAFEVAKRYADATHDPNIMRAVSAGAIVAKASYAIGVLGMRTRPVDRAMVRLTSMERVGGVELPGKRYATIGEYDPTRGWVFYPEYVGERWHRVLAASFDRRAQRAVEARNDAAISTSGCWIDFHHPVTVRVRKEMAASLRGLPLQTLIERWEAQVFPGNSIPRCDDATVAYPALRAQAIRTDIMGITSGERLVMTTTTIPELVLCVSGLRQAKPDGTTVRTNRTLCVGRQRLNEPDAWLSTEHFVEPSEWQTLAPMPGVLQGYAERHSAFSPEYCAVQHNPDSPWLEMVDGRLII